MAKATPSTLTKPPRPMPSSGGRSIRDTATGALSPAPTPPEPAEVTVEEQN